MRCSWLAPVALAGLLLSGAPLRAQESPQADAEIAPGSVPAGDAAALGEEPPFPPPALAGEAPEPPTDDPAETTSPVAGAEADAVSPEAEPSTPAEQRAATPRYLRPPPPSPAPSAPAPPPVVPERITHARGLSLMAAQIPIAVAWGTAAGAASYLSASVLLNAPGLAMGPFGVALVAAPMLAALAGAGVSVLANVIVLPGADALFDAPEVADGTLAQTALWSALYAGIIAAVMGIPLTLPPLFAASGLSDTPEISTMLGYALVASAVPIAVAPLAALEAANDGGYRADLPVWCWHALRICSLGYVAMW